MPFRFSLLPLLFCAFTFAITAVSAEENPVISIPFEQKVTFDPYPDSRGRITNDLLQYIAEGSDRLRSMASFVLKGRITVSLDSTGNDNFQAIIFIKDLAISGDIHYRDFSLHKVLTPDLFQARFTIKKPDGSVYFSREFNDLPIKDSGFIQQVDFHNDINIESLTFLMEGIHLGYSESTYHRLDDWFGCLEDYYKAGDLLEKTGVALAGLNFTDPSDLILDEFTLCEAEIALAVLGREDFFSQLGPQAGDPEGVFEKYDALVLNAQSLRDDFNKRMAIADSLLYESGLSFLLAGQRKEAQERFESSLVLNPFYVPSHLAMAGLDLAGGNKLKTIQRMGEVFSEIRPHGEWRKASEAITDSTMSLYFREAYDLNREGRFKESLDLLAPIEKFCLEVAGEFECPNELAFRLNQTHMGMYRSFLVVAARALRNDNLPLCKTYVSSALEYQRNNSKFIADAREALDLLQQCVYRYIEISGERFTEGNYSESINNLERAIELCNQFEGIFCPEDLSQRQLMISDLLQSNGPTLQNEDNILHETSVPISMETTVKPAEEVIKEISHLQFLAWAGNLENAKEGQEKILITIQKLGLESNSRIVAEVEKLHEMILSKVCELAQREVNSLVSKGVSYLEYSELRLAYQAGMQIRERIESLPQCEFILNDSLGHLLNLEPAIQYLDKMEAAEALYHPSSPERYVEVMKLFYDAQLFYQKKELSQYGVAPPDILRFISLQGNSELALAGVLFMAEYPETYASETVALLWHLKDQGISSSYTRSAQELAGSKLSLHLGSKEVGMRPETILFSLTLNDNWFRFFEKSFKEYWPAQ